MALPSFRRLRQHHAVEHATVAVLFERRGRFRVFGWADFGGFSIVGNVEADEVAEAAAEALRRLQRGQHNLAVTDLCGSNIVITAAMVAAATLGATGKRRWREFPAAVSLGSLAVMAAPFVGRYVQRHLTTEAEVSDLRISGLRRIPHRGGARRHYRVALSPVATDETRG